MGKITCLPDERVNPKVITRARSQFISTNLRRNRLERRTNKTIPLTRRTSQPIAWAGLGVGLSFGTVLCISDLIDSVAVLDSSSEIEKFLPAHRQAVATLQRNVILLDSIVGILGSLSSDNVMADRRE